jgi:hypothetical protein
MDSLTDSHYPDLDFLAITEGREMLWHPKEGNVLLQGKWGATDDMPAPYELVQDELKTALADRKLNWLAMYVARQPDDDIIAECMLNNEAWEDGTKILHDYAQKWPQPGEFLGMKQFVMLRRCDAYDNR